MQLVWDAVVARYAGGRDVRPLTGSSTLRVVSADDEQVCVAQRLWRACVTRAQLEDAVALLGDGGGSRSAVGFSEDLRRHYGAGPQVDPGCSRIPNLCAVLLADLGLLGPAPSTGGG